MDLFEEIRRVICEQFDVKPEEIKPETSFIDNLGADSLDTLELIMALEEEFAMEIPDDDAKNLQTVNDVIKHIKNKINLT